MAMPLLAGAVLFVAGCKGGTERARAEEKGAPEQGPDAGPDSGVMLGLRWEPGKSYLFENSTDSQMKMPFPGQGLIDSNSKMSMRVRNDASEHEKGIKVGTQFEAIRMNVAMSGIVMEYDSEDPAKSGGLIAAVLDPLAKAKFATIYSKDGKLLEMEGLESLQAASQFGFGKAELEAMTRQSAQFVPNRKVAVGETWKSEVSLPMGGLGGDLTLLYTFTLDAIEEREGKKMARISLSGKMKEDAPGEEEKVLKAEARNISGQMLFDIALGQPAEITTSIDLEMAVPDAVPKAEGAPGKMPVKSKSVQRLLKVE